MTKKSRRTKGNPKWLASVNLDVTETIDGDLVGVLGMIDDSGEQIDYYIGRDGADAIMKTLTNFIDLDEGKTPSFPTPH